MTITALPTLRTPEERETTPTARDLIRQLMAVEDQMLRGTPLSSPTRERRRQHLLHEEADRISRRLRALAPAEVDLTA
ncbi:hypothetical protein PZ938_06770 [Luteipulveratus sp. YIM 133132]|uniref:Uncharacterized protein n=1 Tax=Luteipulveratus flavus TaxID=3031728 RepID=A0ABT6C7R9_9MICO|nr:MULTISPECIES: hypothetical protein [unclassified Luteipulveratus]MDE9365305.1 hypothetical protein [Luteipulveratus sp. YIM 133132]MDF8264357.1 hypothetical protein [Luteipulveratus sp. YIM 133296]